MLEILKNKYLSKEQQIKRSFIKGLAISSVLTIGVACIYQFIVIPNIKNTEKIKVINNIEKQKGKDLKVWVLNKDITQGDPINPDKDLSFIKLPKELVADDTIQDKFFAENKVSRMNLKAKTILTNSMLLRNNDILTTDLRKQDYSHILLNKNLQKGNYVDIRYKKKDGTDYVVASKKYILDLNGSTMILKINEVERQYINNSTVAASLTGATLYTTIYVDGENQPPARITYEINNNINNLIKKNPNVVKDAEQEIQTKNNPNSQENEEISTKESISASHKPEFIEGGHNKQ